jgi:cardiolipin synthase
MDLSAPGIFALLAAVLGFVLATVLSGHAILNKQDTRATVAWVGVIWFAPIVGSLLYLLLGINRIHRRASQKRSGMVRRQGESDLVAFTPDALEQFVPDDMKPLSRLSSRVSRQPLLAGNRVEPLADGESFYPRMLAAIRGAQRSIGLSTYIFNRDPTGLEFADALAAAVKRGVEVRVLVDSVGLRYSMPSIERVLRRARVPMAQFMPTRMPWALPFMNLRNHRKILVVDGRSGFVGGANIAEGHRLDRQPSHPVRDLHFEVEGPVVTELQAVFAEDWAFARGEVLDGDCWFPPPETPGAVLARVIADGPDERFDTLRQIISGALSLARRRIRIITPYFLPDATLQDALATAALRGVEVDIILPQSNNLPLVDWASRAQLENLLRWGCRIGFAGGPFDHSKLFTVDGHWSLVGSANWDPRSLSLNFECNLECYDEWLAGELDRFFEARLAESRAFTLEDLAARPLPRRLRDGIARLFSPYL